MADYNPMALPNNYATNVSLSMRIYGISEVNTLESIISIKAELDDVWHDERLMWNPEDYNNITNTVFFTDREVNVAYIWTPEIVCPENSHKSVWDEMERVMALVSYDGTVQFWSNGQLKVKASLHLYMFPYDI